MKDKLIFITYLFLVLFLTSVQNINWLVLTLVIVLLASFKDMVDLIKKTFITTFIFNSVISISFVFISLLKGQSWIDYIIFINLRVFTLTYLSFFVFSKINLFKAFDFNENLLFLITLAYSQILTFKKTFLDLKKALESRLIVKPELTNLHNFVSSTFFLFFNKSLKNSEEISKAMKSRGYFND